MAIALYVLIILVAAGAWVVAALSMIGMLRATDTGKLSLIWHAGWWNWTKVGEILGADGEKHVRRFKKAMFWFFGAIGAGFSVVITQIALEAK